MGKFSAKNHANDCVKSKVTGYLSHPGRFDPIFTLAAVFCA
jgi:hypothetical protein